MAMIVGDPLGTLPSSLEVTTTPSPPRPGEDLALVLRVTHPETGAQVREFTTLHDRPFHLFVVSQSLEHFFHVHPALAADGTLRLGGGHGDQPEFALPAAGYYKLYADFLPLGGTPQVVAQPLITDAYEGDLYSAIPRVGPSVDLQATTGSISVALELDPVEIIAGDDAKLRYRITDAGTGTPVEDLSPYLGAWGHTLVLSHDMVEHLHSHPEEDLPMGVTQLELRGGPDVAFEAYFPNPGLYRIWTQFLRGDELNTVSFDVEAYRLGEAPTDRAQRGSTTQ
jgi:hypothetical protein